MLARVRGSPSPFMELVDPYMATNAATKPTPVERIVDSRETVIKAGSPWANISPTIFWRFRFLLSRLVRRDLTLRYRQTVLGVVWVVIQPIIGAGALSLVFSGFGNGGTGESAFINSFAGYLGWSAFSSVLSKSSGSLLGNQSLVSKVYFPRLLLPASTVGSTMVDMCISITAFLGVLVLRGVPLSPRLLLVPIVLLLLMTMGFGFGSAAGALAVPYRDVSHILPVVMQLLFFLSPVGYALAAAPARTRKFVSWSPISGFLEALRWATYSARDFPTGIFLRALVVTVVAFVSGVLIFNRLERGFSDVI